MKSPHSKWWYALIAIVVFAFIDQYGLFLKWIGWKQYISEWLVVLSIRNTFEVATCLLAVAVMHRPDSSARRTSSG